MLIIGKILEENHIFINIILLLVVIGKQENLLLNINLDVMMPLIV